MCVYRKFIQHKHFLASLYISFISLCEQWDKNICLTSESDANKAMEDYNNNNHFLRWVNKLGLVRFINSQSIDSRFIDIRFIDIQFIDTTVLSKLLFFNRSLIKIDMRSDLSYLYLG
jgi:hypothetical protein